MRFRKTACLIAASALTVLLALGSLAQPATAPGWNAADWKNGAKVFSKDNDVMVTVVLMGPPLWSYRVQGLTCSDCNTGGAAAKVMLEQVLIVSNYVPDPCGNAKAKVFMPVQTHTADWAPNTTGDTLAGPATTTMTFKIECEAKNGPIYLRVDWRPGEGDHKGHVSVGPLPGPVNPE